ncbi:hypothetical protein O1Q96_28300 [Streptomyces sp. Qhu-G9]|uniref:hypothetical protein n=1 Tax=Streptomyces sp. Qhu-G9 TaxID=3452799 RepID=UPI0022AC3FFA|nr:hypothetical protein [Streptomyces aurantiacus]WAU83247.1 hypothetical protein O1Q96_28300 [Streptomyces aurantiacus]
MPATFALAVVLNLADAVWDPSGEAWFASRVAVSVLFTVALVAFAAQQLRNRGRQRP